MGVENGSVTMQPETLKDGRMRKRKRGMIQNGDSSLRWGQHKRSRNAEHHAEPLHFSSWEAVNNPPDRNFGKALGSSGNSAINRTAHSNGQTHRRTEVESLHDKPMMLGKLNLEFFRWPRVLISLSHKEKEDDFMAIKGSKLPQRPRRRDKHVEKSLSYVSPGTWLCELTRERYEVREKKSLRRKRRGLKALGNVDSNSE